MYALPCPCGQTVPVSPGQAGDQTQCTHCGKTLPIPLLRDLRQLPEIKIDEPVNTDGGGSFGGRLMFGLAGLVALVSASFATFALFSAMAVKVDYDMEKHVAYDRAMLMQSAPTDLIQRWAMATKTPLDQRRPFKYHSDAMKKASWNRRMIIGYSVAGVAVLLAIGLAIADRKASPSKASA